MKNKRIAIIVIVAVALACGGYFGLMQFRDTMPVLAEGFGISPPNAQIPDVKPGWDYLVPFTVLCGQDCDKVLSVTLEQPNPTKLKDGYIAFPEECYSWISIDSGSYQGGEWKWNRITFNEVKFGDPIIVEAGHYRKLAIRITMPEGCGYYDEQMQLNVRVSEPGATGFNRIAYDSIWYIVTAPENTESS